MPGEPARRSGSRSLIFGLAVVLVAVVVIVAVNLRSDNGPDDTASRTPPSAQSTTPTTLDPQAEVRAAVIDAYTQSYLALIIVGKDASPDLNDPRLSEHTTGTALVAEQRALADQESKGLILFGEAELHPTVVELGPDTATVVDCSIDTTGLADAKTGAIVQDGGDGHGGATTAQLSLEGGVWKVIHFKDEKRPCVPPVG
jgi:hypothetical protein